MPGQMPTILTNENYSEETLYEAELLADYDAQYVTLFPKAWRNTAAYLRREDDYQRWLDSEKNSLLVT